MCRTFSLKNILLRGVQLGAFTAGGDVAMLSDWAQRLQQRRENMFIGRSAERRLFRDTVTAAVLPFQIIAIVSPGGAGKTTLLKILASDCETEGIDAVVLDGRAFSPNPGDFSAAFRSALLRILNGGLRDRSRDGHPLKGDGLLGSGDEVWHVAARRGRFVLFIDNYDALLPLHHWLCDAFFPRLPQNVLVVAAARQAPPDPWQHDPAWKALVHVLHLDNFSTHESNAYLALRHVPAAEHGEIVRFSHGHPLTLSLIADLYDRNPGFSFEGTADPDLVQTIVRRLAGDVSEPRYRHALEACALVRVMTESLLCAMLDTNDAGDAFAWLYDLSFMDVSPAGIYPHDLARDVLLRDLQWRHPERYDTFRRRAHDYFQARLRHPDEAVRHDALTDFLFLHRHHDVLDPLMGQTGGTVTLPPAERAGRADHTRIRRIVETHDGPDAARIAAEWLALHPEGAQVVRAPDGDVEAFILILRLRMRNGDLLIDGVDGPRTIRNVDDEITHALCAYVLGDNPEGRPLLAEGEAMTVTRFGGDAEVHQRPSPGFAALSVELVRDFLTTPGLKFTFNVMSNPEEWDVFARKLDFFRRLPSFSFTGERLTYGVFMQDWRQESPQQWLARIAPHRPWRPAPDERSTHEHGGFVTTATSAGASSGAISPTTFSEEEWLMHVHQALKHLHTPDVLMKNPLIHTRMVRRAVDDDDGDTNVFAPAHALRRLIVETVQSFAHQPHRRKLYNALHHTYIEPTGTQEHVAELLNIPFSTYRGHLRNGSAALASVLAEREAHTTPEHGG